LEGIVPGEAPFHSGVAILYHRGPVDGPSAEASPLYTHGPSSDMSPSDPSFITVVFFIKKKVVQY